MPWLLVCCRDCPRQGSNFLLLRQKKVTKEKATLVSVTPAELGQPAVLASGGRLRNSPYGLKHLRLLIRLPLRSSAQTQGDPGSGSQRPNSTRTRHGASLFGCWVLVSHAVMRRRVAQGTADQGWRCLSAASLASPRWSRATQRACSEAEGRRIRLAFLLGTLLWRSKEKDLGRRAETRPAKNYELLRRSCDF
jgi:hypothetical protein